MASNREGNASFAIARLQIAPMLMTVTVMKASLPTSARFPPNGRVLRRLAATLYLTAVALTSQKMIISLMSSPQMMRRIV
jgi:hypothetical protein